MNKELSVYIHIPFCKSKCTYCDFFSKPGIESFLDDYVNSLCNEIFFYSQKAECKELKTIYIGGGTPSLLSIPQLQKLFNKLESCFAFSDKDFEATIELNPDDVNDELIFFLENSFINRLSLGIQSLNHNTLSLMNRRASRENSLKALKIISEKFTGRFSLDLIAGFPGEDEKILVDNINQVLSFNPEHISLYSLCVEEGTCLYNQISQGKLDFDQELSDECWIKGKDYLEEKGFVQYEISNFSKSEKSQSFHNLNYWHLNNYLGFGSGAAGSLFFSDSSVRYTNTSDIGKYIQFWSLSQNRIADLKLNCFNDWKTFLNLIPADFEEISKEVEEYEFLMMNFRLAAGVSEKEYNLRFCKNLENRLNENSDLFSDWMKDGKAEIILHNGDRFFRLTENGLLYLNCFLEKL